MLELSEQDAQSMLSRSFCNVSFLIHPTFYSQSESGEPTPGPVPTRLYHTDAKDFCVCRGCKLTAIRTCLGETEGGITRQEFPSGLTLNLFTCDACNSGVSNDDQKPKCCICEDKRGLFRRTSNGHWLHYTCALLVSNKVRILNLGEMRFELIEDMAESGKNSEVKRHTRSKKSAQEEPVGIYPTLMNQIQLVISREKESDDAEFTLYRFILNSKEEQRHLLFDSKEMLDVINGSVEFGSGPKPKKHAKKKSKQHNEAINVSSLLNIDTKEGLITDMVRYLEKAKTSQIKNELHERYVFQQLLPTDPVHSYNYCNCFEAKELENFVLCDECQIWYHCSCVDFKIGLLNDTESFVCNKCKMFKTLETKRDFNPEDLFLFKKERLNIDEMIVVGIYSEKAINEATTSADVAAYDFTCFELSPEVQTRQAEILLNSYLIDKVTTLLSAQDLARPYKDGVVDNEEFAKFKTLVTGARSVGHISAGMESLSQYAKFKILLEHAELILQLYEEIKPRVLRLPVLIDIAKRIEQVPALRSLQAQKNFISALTVAKSKLHMIVADFRAFSEELDKHIAANDISAVQNCKLHNNRLQEYRKDVTDNTLAFRVIESMLSDLNLIEAERNTEIPLKLDYFLVVLKRELKSLFKAGDSEIAAVWQDKRHLFEKSKIVVQKVQKLKTELPQWREVAELGDPDLVLATRKEVDQVLEESEDSVLVMNSQAIKKLSDLKANSIRFEKRNSHDHWTTFDSSKRHIFNIMKSGVLFSDDVIKMTRELKTHGHIAKFCHHRASFSLPEIEALLTKSERRFEKDLYDQADMLVEEIKLFVSQAAKIQDRHDLWTDSMLEECLRLYKKLSDYKIKLPENLSKFAGIARSVLWLMEIAEQSGVDLESMPSGFINLKYPFESTLEKLLLAEHLFDNFNIRTLIRLEKAYPPGIFPYHPGLYILSCRSAKRVCQKELEELLVGGSLMHVEDLKHLLRKWTAIDHEFSTLPPEMKSILDSFKTFKVNIKNMLDHKKELMPLTLTEMEFARDCLQGVSGYTGLAGLDVQFDIAQRIAVILLSFSVKVQKMLLFTYPELNSIRFGHIEPAEMAVLQELIQTVTNHATKRPLTVIASPEWTKKLLSLKTDFSKRVKEGSQLTHQIDILQQSGEQIVNKIGAMRKDKEKTVSLQVILDEIQHKPKAEEAEELLEKLREFGSVDDEKIQLLERYSDDVRVLEETLRKLIFDTKIDYVLDDANKTRFATYEKDFLRLLKRAEILPVYKPIFRRLILAANSCYKIYKLYFEPAKQSKWAKVNESINETVHADPEIEAILKKVGILEGFRDQLSLIEQITQKLVKEKIHLSELSELAKLASQCKAQLIGNVEIQKLKQNCEDLDASVAAAHKATPTNKLPLDTIEQCRNLIDNFDLHIEEADTDFIYNAIDEHKALLRMLQIAQREQVLYNGFLTDFTLEKYSRSIISNKSTEELLTTRANSLNQYANIEAAIKNLKSDAYIELEQKINSLKPSWDILNRKLQLMLWIRKSCAIRSGKHPINLLGLECFIAEGREFFERSKKLIPREQRIICCSIVNKIQYLEELLDTTDSFLEALSKSKTSKDLDDMNAKFKDKDRVDLSDVVIDMRTQLNYGPIDYSSKKRRSIVPEIKQMIGSTTAGEITWDEEHDFRNLEELFKRLYEQDKMTLHSRFKEMMEGGSFMTNGALPSLALDGTIKLPADDSNLIKRKPLRPTFTPTNGSAGPKRMELVSKVNEDGTVNLVNSHTLFNLSNSAVDNDAITDSLRESITMQILATLRENPFFSLEESTLRQGSKNLEMHLFSNDHKSRSAYQRAFLFLRTLLGRLSLYESISREIQKNNFSYDHIMQFKDKSDQRLMSIERELKTSNLTAGSGYNPLGMSNLNQSSGASNPLLSLQAKQKDKNRIIDVVSDNNMFSDVLKHLEIENVPKNNKLMKALGSGKVAEPAPKKSPAKEQERSRSRSRSEDSSKKRRQKEKEKEKKKEKKEKKKKSNEKSKFSSESEDDREEEQQAPRISRHVSQEEQPVKQSQKLQIPIESRNPQVSNERKAETVQPEIVSSQIASKQPPGSWLKINNHNMKDKIRIFTSEQKKSINEGYSISCTLNTSEPDDVIGQFPEFTKVPTFVFDKYAKEVEDIEMQYQRKLALLRKAPLPASSHTILAGWILPEGDEKERTRLEYLGAYLTKKGQSLSHMIAPGLTIHVALGKQLKIDTLKAIGVKEKYDSGEVVDLDKLYIFFLRRSIDKEDAGAKKLTSVLVQPFDKSKENTFKLIFGPREIQPETQDKKKDNKDKKKDKETNGNRSGNDMGDKAPMDETMVELLTLVKGLDTEAVKELIKSIADSGIKQKLYNIIRDHLPHLRFIIPDEDGIKPLSTPPPTLPLGQPPIMAPPQPFYHQGPPMAGIPMKTGQPMPSFASIDPKTGAGANQGMLPSNPMMNQNLLPFARAPPMHMNPFMVNKPMMMPPGMRPNPPMQGSSGTGMMNAPNVNMSGNNNPGANLGNPLPSGYQIQMSSMPNHVPQPGMPYNSGFPPGMGMQPHPGMYQMMNPMIYPPGAGKPGVPNHGPMQGMSPMHMAPGAPGLHAAPPSGNAMKPGVSMMPMGPHAHLGQQGQQGQQSNSHPK